MVEVTRVGNVIVLEYFTKEEKRILEGKNLKKREREKHRQMLEERDYAFAEISRVCKVLGCPKADPLKIEPHKFRNQNAMANPFLRM